MKYVAAALVASALFALCAGTACSQTSRADAGANALPTLLSSLHVHHLYRVSSNLFSGSLPGGDAAFAEIARLGVKTVISVDGSKPDVDTARKHGLRYVHLPFGYDGVPSQRVAELVKAAQTSTSSVYVHCHHGLHRGPTAAAIICEATAGWSTNQAVAWLKRAGTAADYPGLYRSALEFRPPDPAAMARLTRLPEVSKTTSLVETMVTIDEIFGRLKAAETAKWKELPNQPNRTSVQSATLLWEQLRELARTQDTAQRPEPYRIHLTTAETGADRLRILLRDPDSDAGARSGAFRALAVTCDACHKQFRNN